MFNDFDVFIIILLLCFTEITKKQSAPTKVQEVGLLVSTPSAYYRDLAKESLEDIITSECADEYIGSVKDSIEGTVKLVNVFYSKNYESYIYTGKHVFIKEHLYVYRKSYIYEGNPMCITELLYV